MGTCHIEMSRKLLGKLLLKEWKTDIHITSASYFGEKDFYHVFLESSLLPDGYNGQMNIILEEDSFKFKKDQDVDVGAGRNF